MTAGAEHTAPGLDYLTGCLFDSSQTHGSITTYVFDVDKHREKFKESWAIERFGALWVNYLWIEEPPPTNGSGWSLNQMVCFIVGLRLEDKFGIFIFTDLFCPQ